MSNIVEFIVKLKDMVSGGVAKIGTNVSTTFNAMERNFQRFERTNWMAGRSIDQLNEGLNRLYARRGSLIVSGPEDLHRLRQINSQIRDMETRIGRMQRGSGIGSLFQDAANQLPFFNLARNPLVLAGAAGFYSAKQGMDTQADKTRLQVLLGGEAQGNAMFDSLQDFANKTPFGRGDLMKASGTMLGFGLDKTKIVDYLQMLGDVSMGDVNKLNSLTLAFSQIQANGRLMGEDLLQLINAGFNPLEVIAQKTGETIGELKKRMEEGQISAEMVTRAFEAATGPGGRFNGMMDKMSMTLGGQLSTFMDKLATTASNLGMLILPPLTKALSFVNATLEFLTANIGTIVPVLGVLTTGFVLGNASMVGYAIGTKIAALATAFLTSSFVKLTVAMVSNPIGGLTVLLVGLALLFKHLWETSDKFRAHVMGAWEALKAFADGIKNVVIDRLKTLVTGVYGIGRSLYLLFTGEFKQAFEVGKEAVLDLTGYNTAVKAYQGAQSIGKAWNEGVAKGLQDSMGKVEGVMISQQNRFNRLALMSQNSFFSSQPWFQSLTKGMKFDDPSQATKEDWAFTTNNAKSHGDRMASGSVRSITFNIQTLGVSGGMTIHAQTVGAALDQLDDIVAERLNRILDGVGGALTR